MALCRHTHTSAKFQLLSATACPNIEAFTPGTRIFHHRLSLIPDGFAHNIDLFVDIVRELAWACSTDENWVHTRRSVGPVEARCARLLSYC